VVTGGGGELLGVIV
ncbi:unnamed protein product, partial [Adineta steineri]